MATHAVHDPEFRAPVVNHRGGVAQVIGFAGSRKALAAIPGSESPRARRLFRVSAGGGRPLPGGCSTMEMYADERHNEELLSFLREKVEHFYKEAISDGVKDPVVLIYEVDVFGEQGFDLGSM
jgi:hypothetical protein